MTRAHLLTLAATLVPFVTLAADVAADGHFVDDAGTRYLTLSKAGFDTTRVAVRFASEPGSTGQWAGTGQRKDKVLTFAQEAGENEDRGTFYVANVSESKVDIAVKPGQKKAQDAGIVGTYRHASDQKLEQLAKKEFQAANTRLITAFKNAPRKWSAADRPALQAWKDQWPAMRDRWMSLALPPAKTPAASAVPADKPTDYWVKLAQATAAGYYFIEGMPDPKVGTGAEGEYDDFAGGHVSLTIMKDGGLHVTLTINRADGTQTGTIDTLVKASNVSKDKTGSLSADFTVEDPEVADASQRAKIHLTKTGHYLQVGASQTRHYSQRAWFDGIYRGTPPAAE